MDQGRRLHRKRNRPWSSLTNANITSGNECSNEPSKYSLNCILSAATTIISCTLSNFMMTFSWTCCRTIAFTTIEYVNTSKRSLIFATKRKLSTGGIINEMSEHTTAQSYLENLQSEVVDVYHSRRPKQHHMANDSSLKKQSIRHVDKFENSNSKYMGITNGQHHAATAGRDQNEVQQDFDNTLRFSSRQRRRIDSNNASNIYSGNSTTMTNFTNSSIELLSHNYNPNKGILQIQSFCKHNYVQVTSLQLLCDTPGAYYYGSNAYRKSEVCQSGDKAFVEMDFIVPNRMVDRTIYMQVELGFYDHFQVVNTTVLCALPVTLVKAFPPKILQGPIVTVMTMNDTNATITDDDADANDDDDDIFVNDDAYVLSRCTNVSGRYHLSTFYHVPKINDNNLHYTPDIRLTFTDVQARKVGCTVSGPYSILVENDTRSEHGYIALAISCSIFIFVFAFLLMYSSTYGKNRSSTNSNSKGDKMNAIDDDDDDEILKTTQKAILAQRRRLHHLNQYQYFRTLPNGQVIPLPGVQQIPSKTPAYSPVAPKGGDSATSVPSQQHFYYYKSPRPVITVTRHVSADRAVASGTTGTYQQASNASQNLSTHQYQLPAYLQNIPNSSTDEDESHDDDDDDDDDNRHQLKTNPQYNETHLPTRPVI